jgi:hypothetical protein
VRCCCRAGILTVVVMIKPNVVAIATPARNGKETLSALGDVTKIIAAMICGPAIIVIARGRIAWFMASPCMVALGSWTWSRRKAGSCPAPSRGVNWPRNEGSILLS